MLSFHPAEKIATPRAEVDWSASSSLGHRPVSFAGGKKPALRPLNRKSASIGTDVDLPAKTPRSGQQLPAMKLKASMDMLLQSRRPLTTRQVVGPKEMQPEHGDCLKLPIGLDRLWLLLPEAKRPSVTELLPISHETAMDTTEDALMEAVAKALFGSSGPALLASFANTAEARPPWTPRRLLEDRSVLQMTRWQCVPMRKEKVKEPEASQPCMIPEPPRDGRRRPFNTRWADVFADQLLSERAQAEMEETMRSQAESQAHRMGGTLDLREWSSRCPTVLDEKGLAIVALACSTRPSHVQLFAGPISLENFRLLSLWSRLQHIRIEGGEVLSIVGIEACRMLQDVSLLRCRKLRDVSPLGTCAELRSIDLRGCTELVSLGDVEAARPTPYPSDSVFSLSDLQRVNLLGCNGLCVEQLLSMHSAVKWIVLPTAKITTQCAVRSQGLERSCFSQDVKSAAQDFLQELVELIEPPVTCSWDQYRQHMAEVLQAKKYAGGLGVPDETIKAAWFKWNRAKLIVHLAFLTSEENAVLRTRSGRRGPARLRRCFVLIRWLKIRRLEGVTRKDFCHVLSKALDEPSELLSRVYNFMDVEREEVLTQEDFDRLVSFDGAASWQTVDKFRSWAFEKFGGLQKLWSAITRANTAGAGTPAQVLSEYVDYWAFEKALRKLGFTGKANEIFAILNDHVPKTPHLTSEEFQLLDWLWLSQIAKFKRWMVERHGSTRAAFKAMDANKSKVIAFSEFRKYLDMEMPTIEREDCERAFRLIDYNDSHSITMKEFEVLSKMDVDKLLEDLSCLRKLILAKWGTFHDAFVSMSSIKVSDLKARLGKKARKSKASGIRFVHFQQLKLAAEEIGYEPTHDLRLIFRYLDFNMEGTVVLEDFMALPVATVGDTRECFDKVKAYLLKQWGSFSSSYSGFCRAVQLEKEADKNK